MNVSFLQELMNAVAERGRQLLPRSLIGGEPADEMAELSAALVSGRGEASGVAIARELLDTLKRLDDAGRQAFYLHLAKSMGPDLAKVQKVARAFADQPSMAAYRALASAVEPPRQEFFRRLNLAPGATAEIVGLRRDMLRHLKDHPELAEVDEDLKHLLGSWFNRGFLMLRRIDWSTPANILEKIIAYEAVHEIQGWDDLRRRLDPADRRCFAFFHPAMVDEPLIFVEVALRRDTPGSIQELLSEERKPVGEPAQHSTAVFYSISNCQEGLRGITFGNFLIKQVVEDLARELPSLKTFVTLSPVPGFARWLARELADPHSITIPESDRYTLQLLSDSAWIDDEEASDALRRPLLALAAHYFLVARQPDGRPVDPVARFHLGNGARLERINWAGDVSEKGLKEAHGLMVNYLYEIKEIERNHEAYATQGTIMASRAVRGSLRAPAKSADRAKSAEPSAAAAHDSEPASVTARAALPAPARSAPEATAAPASGSPSDDSHPRPAPRRG